MSNHIIPIDNYEFKSNKTYFFDNNVWIALFAPLINTNTNQQRKASAFLKTLHSYNSQLVITSLILSEFSNTFVRFSFEQWKKKTHNPTANYKRDFKKTQEFADTLDEVKTLIKAIFELELIEKYPDNFNSVNIDDVLNNFEIDFNDAYYYQQCLFNNWILVTADNDFDSLNGNLTIIKL